MKRRPACKAASRASRWRHNAGIVLVLDLLSRYEEQSDDDDENDSNAMLFLIFQLGVDWYAVETAQVVEVLPRVSCKEIPQAPTGVAGVFNYHGAPVPLIDLAALSLGKPSRARMSTRIILINYVEPGGETHLLGLLAEQATETIRRDKSDFVEARVTAEGAPYLGTVTKDPRGLIQLIDPHQLLSQSVRDALFRKTAEV